MRTVQTMGDARAARSEMKGAMSGEEQELDAMLGVWRTLERLVRCTERDRPARIVYRKLNHSI